MEELFKEEEWSAEGWDTYMVQNWAVAVDASRAAPRAAEAVERILLLSLDQG